MLYVILNASLAVSVLLLVLVDLVYLSFFLIILSKWRVFAVRPRFWFANVQANIVDALVGLSAVTLIWQADGALIVQGLLCAAYAAWLIVIKPRSKRHWVVIQAGISQFVSVWALSTVAYDTLTFLVVAGMWLIGYSACRHVLVSYDEQDRTLLSLIWGVVVANIGWVAYHVTIVYAPMPQLAVPQLAVIVSVLAFAAHKIYDVLMHPDDDKRAAQVKVPLIFSAILLLIVILFSRP